MNFEYSPKVKALITRVDDFMKEHILPAEAKYHEEVEKNRRAGNAFVPVATMDELKAKARKEGLWNMFLPHSQGGAGLSNFEYAPLCELMGRSHIGSEPFNCSAPDTGNMETIERYGTPEQKKKWLEPLLAGEIRSAFAMTEPAVASSDATNITTSIARDGDEYVINGRKWWITG